jgi:hypothetical protein
MAVQAVENELGQSIASSPIVSDLEEWLAATRLWRATLVAGGDPGPVPIRNAAEDPLTWRHAIAAAAAVSRMSADDVLAERYPDWLPADCIPATRQLIDDLCVFDRVGPVQATVPKRCWRSPRLTSDWTRWTILSCPTTSAHDWGRNCSVSGPRNRTVSAIPEPPIKVWRWSAARSVSAVRAALLWPCLARLSGLFSACFAAVCSRRVWHPWPDRERLTLTREGASILGIGRRKLNRTPRPLGAGYGRLIPRVPSLGNYGTLRTGPCPISRV